MTTTEGLSVGKARSKQFCALIMRFGTIPRGSLIDKMGVSNGIFAHEFRDFLEAYPNIHYNVKTREFSYEP
jgi:hypothetical protein